MISAEEVLLDLAIDDMPVSGDEVREAMVAWKAEILREAVQKIRAENPDRDADFSAGVDWAIDVIDPDKED